MKNQAVYKKFVEFENFMKMVKRTCFCLLLPIYKYLSVLCTIIILCRVWRFYESGKTSIFLLFITYL